MKAILVSLIVLEVAIGVTGFLLFYGSGNGFYLIVPVLTLVCVVTMMVQLRNAWYLL